MSGGSPPPLEWQRMRRAGENGLAEGMALARQLVDVATELARGVYFMPSFGRYDAVAELVAAARE